MSVKCGQHFAAEKMYMPQSGERIISTSARCPLQRLHRDFGNALWDEGNEDRRNVTEGDIQTAGYSATVSERFELPLKIFEGSHCIVRAVHQSPVKKLGLVSAARLVKMPPFSVLRVSKNTVYVGFASRDSNKAFTCAADGIRCCFQFVEEGYSLPDQITYLRDLKQRFLEPPTTK